MRTKLFIVLWILAALYPARPTLDTAHAQEDGGLRLDACREGAFSTEEDFVMQMGEPENPIYYVSDGDILSPTGEICVRNTELIRRLTDFEIDLGLDALDILDFESELIAFSTELDDPHGRFGAGDLILTNGIIIPNEALVSAFGIGYDVGLDEVKFMGSPDNIMNFINDVIENPVENWETELVDRLGRFEIDIWFSIEGTAWGNDKRFLDGDILSVVKGDTIATNADLLGASFPAGIPNNGVDFGVDAFAVAREELGAVQPTILFSTEILYNDGERSFTDGDVLVRDGGVVITNDMLVVAFKPSAFFLGLDALWLPSPSPKSSPSITHLCDWPTAEFDGGTVAVGDPGTGLRASPLTAPPALTSTNMQPCGMDIPIRGFLTTDPNDPVGNVTRFRVAYREFSEPIPTVAGDPATYAVTTTWTVYAPKQVWNGMNWKWECKTPVKLATDAYGWMNAKDFMDARYGTGQFVNQWIRCDNPELRLAVWDSDSLPVGQVDADNQPTGEPLAGVQDREDHYVLWLEWEDTSLTMHREDVEHHIQLDNTLPIIAQNPDGLQVHLPNEEKGIAACGDTGTSTDQIEIWGQFKDQYYQSFFLVLSGGNPPATVSYGQHYYYDPTDGTTAIKNTDETGTIPDGTTVHLRDINMTALGKSFQDCCYALEIYVYDRAIRHSFTGSQVNVYTSLNYTHAITTFAAHP
ncbi:MAG TPA: hypothetical protein VHP83_16060 [Aggregatilineaceae bacterium]|nr:hypothetical protein [Aggregatilineaceae bacterium]